MIFTAPPLFRSAQPDSESASLHPLRQTGRVRRPPVLLASALTLATLLAGLSACSGDPDPAAGGAGHTHGTGAEMVSMPVGDGTAASDVGYSLSDVQLTGRAGQPGRLSFRILDRDDEPVTEFLEELTKDLHLYVVREDLEVFRHLHPTMDEDGTWSTSVNLPAGGDYRVITEFVAVDDGGNGDHLVLGGTVAAAGDPDTALPPADTSVEVTVRQSPSTGPNGRLELVLRDAQGRPVRLGTYLGTYAHVTGFHRESGSVIHTHPLTDPEVTEDGSAMVFHTEIEQAGAYRLFVQVRVDGFLHTVPVELEVTEA